MKLVAEHSRDKGRAPEESGLAPSSLVLGRVVAPGSKPGDVGTRESVTATSAAWVVMLARYEWAWFCTFTFKDAIHPEAADKKFRVWVSKVGESYLGRNQHRQSKAGQRPTWVRGLEWQRRNVLHYHALIGNVPANYIEFAWRVFFRQLWTGMDENCGHARIDGCDGSSAIYSYLTKYVVKGGEIDISANLRAESPRLTFA